MKVLKNLIKKKFGFKTFVAKQNFGLRKILMQNIFVLNPTTVKSDVALLLFWGCDNKTTQVDLDHFVLFSQ